MDRQEGQGNEDDVDKMDVDNGDGTSNAYDGLDDDIAQMSMSISSDNLLKGAGIALCRFDKIMKTFTGEQLSDLCGANYEKFKSFTDSVAELSDRLVEINNRNKPVEATEEQLLSVMERIFGIRQFREKQFDVMRSTLLRQHSFVLMPTGHGKSLCFVVPGLINIGVTVVFTPLLSLMVDQVTKLKQYNVAAEYISGEMHSEERERIKTMLEAKPPTIKFLYLTPEMFIRNGGIQEAIDNLDRQNYLSRVVLDEVDCISEWGHDFRLDYSKLSILHVKYPHVPFMMLTATASVRVQRDIQHMLQVLDVKVFALTPNRPNVSYNICKKISKQHAQEEIVRILNENMGASAIIYCLSMKDCNTMAAKLNIAGITAGVYYSELSRTEKEETQEQWHKNEKQCICCTTAFGMGIDKPDVRLIFHHSLPKTVEGFHQETGRCGRDGLPAQTFLYYSHSDIMRYQYLFEKSEFGTDDTKTLQMNHLLKIEQFCVNRIECRRTLLLQYFGIGRSTTEKCSPNEQQCDNCRSLQSIKLIDVRGPAKLVLDRVKSLTTAYISLETVASRLVKETLTEWDFHKVYRLLKLMVQLGVLRQTYRVNNANLVLEEISLGANAVQLEENKRSIMLPVILDVNQMDLPEYIKNKMEEMQNFCLDEITKFAYKHFTPKHIHLGTLKELAKSLPTSIDTINDIIAKAKRMKFNSDQKRELLELTQRFYAERDALVKQPRQ